MKASRTYCEREMAEEVVSQAMGEENGPITRRVAYSGMVEVKNLLFFSEWIRFELTAMWLRASKNDRVGNEN